MKIITVAGRLGKDSELKRTQTGDPVLNFSVAVNDGYGENKSTMWFDCSLFGKRGEALAPYLKKGSSVCVSGDLGKREHEGKTYLKVRVNDIQMMDGGHKSDGEQGANGFSQDLDDEIPF